jgi:streptogramin lyase
MRRLRPAQAVIAAMLLCSAAAEARHRAVAKGEAPVVRAVAPASIPIAGGTLVTIIGSGFTSDVKVFFDGAPLPFVRNSNQELILAAPPHANGYVPLALETRLGRGAAELFYVPPPLDSLPPGFITTVAGIGKYLGEGREARQAPVQASDFALGPDGSIYLAETIGVVLRIAPNGIVERFAGIGADFAGDDIGDGRDARDATLVFCNAATVGPDGGVYIADAFNNRVRRVDPVTHIITTVAGSGPNGTCCSGTFGGDGGPAAAAKLNTPNQVRFDGRGNLYILDTSNSRIRRVSPDGIIATIAGIGTRGFSGDGGPAAAAQIDIGANTDYGAMQVDPDGNVYLGDHFNRRIRRIDAATGIIDTIVGGGDRVEDGVTGREVQLQNFFGVGIDAQRRVYFTDPGRLRRLDADGRVRTVAGTLDSGLSPDGTPLKDVRLGNPARMHIAANGDIYLVDATAERLVRLDAAGLHLLAGTYPKTFGENGPGIGAQLDTDMHQAALDAAGNLIFGGGQRLRKLRKDGVVETIAGGAPPDPTLRGDQPRLALAAGVIASGVAIDKQGNIYICDREVGRIDTDGIYTPLTQFGRGFSGDGGPAKDALIDNGSGMAVDSKGNLYIADFANNRIRRIDAATGIIDTICGNGPPHPPDTFVPDISSGDGGPAKDAHIRFPTYMTVDAQNRLYIGDTDRIRRIDTDGIIRTVLSACYGPLFTTANGEVLVYCNFDVRRIEGPEVATTIARVGGGGDGIHISGDGGPASLATVKFSSGIAADDRTIYIMESESRRIRAVRR